MADYQHFSQQRPHMRKAPRSTAARHPKRRRSALPIVAGILVLAALAGAGFGIYTLDKELAARVFNTPAPLANK